MDIKLILMIVCIAIIALSFVLFLLNRISDNLYIALAILLMGTIFTVSYPASTMISWDDESHYLNSLYVSRVFSPYMTKADEEMVNNIYEGGAPKLLSDHKTDDFAGRINKLYKTDKTRIPFERNIMPNILLSYAPSAIALLIGRALSLPFTYTFFLGKWINVLFYAVLIYFALKKLRSGKMIIFAISMFPTTLLLASNYSYDTWGIGLSILAFSWYIGILQDENKKMYFKDIIIISILFILAFCAKAIYFCLVPAILYIKKEKFGGKLSRVSYTSIVLATTVFIALTFVLPFFVSGIGGNDMRGGETVNSALQVKYILGNPLTYTKTLLGFLKNYWSIKNSVNYMSHMAYLGWVGYHIPYFITVLIMVVLDKKKEDVHVTNAINRVWIFFLAFSSSVLVATAMYVAFTPVGSGTIEGCQERYLLPILFLVGYFISDYRIVKPIRKIISDKILTSVSSLILIAYASYAIYTHCYALY